MNAAADAEWTATDGANAAETADALIEFLYRSPIGLVQIAADGAIEMLNPMSSQLLMPLSRDGGLDNLYDTLSTVAPQLRSLAGAVDAAGGVVCESLRVAVDGSAAASGDRERSSRLLSISLLKLADQRLMAVLVDATSEAQREQSALASRLDAAARIGSLTRLASLAGVRERLQRTIDATPAADGSQFALLFLNCDRFKRVNDALGHAAGDEVLAMIADRLRGTLRPRDAVGRSATDGAMTARIGGDEFVIVIDGMRHADDVNLVADRLVDVPRRPYGIGVHQVHCTASIGIVLQPRAEGDADAVMRDASLAMVEAKRTGGARCVIFEPGMREQAARRGGIEEDLRLGIQRGELFVVYQPVVALAGGTAARGVANTASGRAALAGVEALVRWRHPSRGVVPPFEFIGIAEDCGLICSIGEQVLEVACRQFAAWQTALGERAPRTLAVNLSRAQLTQPGFVEFVARTLAESGVEPHRLQLEVTESLAAQDASVQARLHELKALGITLALDDFGTGYSSLASLHLLPVDTVKIDRSFVSAAATNRHQQVLIEATVRVAGSLGMNTVAEGIETEEQAEMVHRLGCDKGQGYLYSRPLTADDLLGWIDADVAVVPFVA